VPLLGVALNGVLLALSAIAAILNVTIVPLLQGLNTGAGRFVVTVGLLALAVNGATTAFTLLAFRMGFVDPIASGLIGSIRAFISILQVQFAASVSSAGSALAALRAALLSVNAAFVALAAVAAIGAVVAFTVAVDASKKTVDAWKNSVDNTGSTIGRFTKRLKELQNQQKAGTITEEGRKQLEGYKKLLAETATDIPRQIKDLQDAVDNNKSFAVFKLNEDEAKEEIKRLKQFLQDIVNNLDETTIAGQKAANQGTLKEQFNTVSNNYYDEFKKGTNRAVTQAKTFVGVLQEEIELGARSKEEGLKRLKEISEGEFLLKEDRVAAAKAATAIIDKENKAQADSNNTKQAAIQAQIEAGSLSEIDGIKKTSSAQGGSQKPRN
jgi:gas vesicle protein